jgi:prephenate dehydratase
MAKRLAYLGPPGTFTEEAALRYDASARHLPFQSLAAVATAVSSDMADEGVMGIENSLGGSVIETLDILIHETQLLICHELVLPIDHYLLAPSGTETGDIKAILSHPQALAQCRRFLESCFPRAELIAALSTTSAVEEMMSREGTAAISTLRAAEIYGAQILASKIQDNPENATRFVVLGAEDHPRTGDDKTSLAFAFADDRPGLLVSALQEFSSRNINLSKVESRPTKERLGEYIFLVDLLGHREDPQVTEALEQVRQKATFFKVFGSYPRFRSAD